MLKAILNDKKLVIIIVVVLTMLCCCVTSPFTGVWVLIGKAPFANQGRVNDASSHKYVNLSDIQVLTCGDEQGCGIEFEHQEPFIMANGEQYIEFDVSNEAAPKLSERFEITEFEYTNGVSAVCTYYPPFVTGEHTSKIRCAYPKNSTQVCLTLSFPDVHKSLLGDIPVTTQVCQSIDGGN